MRQELFATSVGKFIFTGELPKKIANILIDAIRYLQHFTNLIEMSQHQYNLNHLKAFASHDFERFKRERGI